MRALPPSLRTRSPVVEDPHVTKRSGGYAMPTPRPVSLCTAAVPEVVRHSSAMVAREGYGAPSRLSISRDTSCQSFLTFTALGCRRKRAPPLGRPIQILGQRSTCGKQALEHARIVDAKTAQADVFARRRIEQRDHAPLLTAQKKGPAGIDLI